MSDKEKEPYQEPYTGPGEEPASEDGELNMAVRIEHGKVALYFGKPTCWVGMDREQALVFADTVKNLANKLLE